ncbi:MAG: hypothetical protein NTX75_12935 [Proteobacteria bacterium]|nr:hypothetical protein [Pseudomonadota bacterium]
MTKKTEKVDLSCIELPAILFRNHPKFKELVGISARTMSNLDSLGLGPSEKIQVGRTVGYRRQVLLDWMQERAVSFGK